MKRRTTKAGALRAAFVVVSATAAAGAFVMGSTSSCASSPDRDQLTVAIVPDLDTYVTNVDAYLTRRCGTLDCHGQPGRAYRIYSTRGFRLPSLLDGSLVSGEQATDPAERRANFQALVAIEPEEISRFMAANAPPDDLEAPRRLLFLRKAQRIERHKGGAAMAEDDPGYRCVLAWLRIPVVRGDGTPIPPNERQKLTQQQIDQCTIAANLP